MSDLETRAAEIRARSLDLTQKYVVAAALEPETQQIIREYSNFPPGLAGGQRLRFLFDRGAKSVVRALESLVDDIHGEQKYDHKESALILSYIIECLGYGSYQPDAFNKMLDVALRDLSFPYLYDKDTMSLCRRNFARALRKVDGALHYHGFSIDADGNKPEAIEKVRGAGVRVVKNLFDDKNLRLHEPLYAEILRASLLFLNNHATDEEILESKQRIELYYHMQVRHAGGEIGLWSSIYTGAPVTEQLNQLFFAAVEKYGDKKAREALVSPLHLLSAEWYIRLPRIVLGGPQSVIKDWHEGLVPFNLGVFVWQQPPAPPPKVAEEKPAPVV